MGYKAEGLFWAKFPAAVGLITEVRAKTNLGAGSHQSHFAHSTGNLH